MKYLVWLLCGMIAWADAQIDSLTMTVGLQLGRIDAPLIMLVELPRINTGVVFQRLPHPAVCPVGRQAEFALKKINPHPSGTVAIEHIGIICSRIDSVTINTELVYEINTASGQLYYMQLVEPIGEGVRIRITSQKPSAIFPSTSGKQSRLREGRKYLSDGKTLPGAKSGLDAARARSKVFPLK